MENHQKVYKRQKNLMQKADDIELKNNYTSTSDDQLIGNTSKSSDLTPSVISDKPSSNITICGFCQSARVSEVKSFLMASDLKAKLFICCEPYSTGWIYVSLGQWRNAALLQRESGVWR